VYVAYIQLAGSVLFNVASYVVYKAIVGLPPRVWWPLFFVGLILGAINTFLFTRSIKLIELSVAYPVFSGACFALISLVSVMAFDEPLRRVNILGLLLVVVGIVLVTQSE
jgi:multidrug transporter EmrE-like cation transporter